MVIKMKITPILLALVMTASLLLTSQFGFVAAGIIIVIMLAVFFVYVFITHRLDMGILLVVALFAVSSFSYSYSVSSYAHKTINHINRYVTLQGTIISSADKSQTSDNYRYVFRVKNITNKNGTAKTSDNILLTTPYQYKCGTSLEIKGIIKDMPKKMNENGFDAALHYKSSNIFTKMYSEEIHEIEYIPVTSIYALGEYVGERIDNIIYSYYEGDGAAILSAVLTGNKHHFSKEYDDILHATAFHRILHPAHLHIMLIFTIIGLFSRVIKRKYRDIFAAVVFIVYAVLQCSNIGFTRCLVCAALTIYYRLRYGRAYMPDTLSAVIIFCCVAMPTMLFNVSFILSCAGGLAGWAFIPHIRKKIKRGPKIFRRTAAAMIVFALVLTPIVAYFYSGLCMYSFLTPFITMPLVVSIIVLSPIAYVMDLIFGASPIIGAYLNLAVRILYKLPYVIAELPFSSINIGKPSLTFELMFICLVLTVYYKLNAKQKQVFVFSAITAGLFGVVVLSGIMRIGSAEFMYVNVGQGDGSIIHIPYKETIVIDAGGGNEFSEYNTGEALFLPYLQAKGINHIEAVLVSHYHKDHAEGVINVIESIRTDYVFMPVITDADREGMKELANEICNTAKENGTMVYFVKEDTRLEFKSGLVLDIYSPSETLRITDENNTTLPVKVQYGEFSALYTGDMTSRGEQELAERADIDTVVLKAAHHGSRNSTSEEFVDAVTPQCVVISCGEDNMYGHPHTETLDRLSDVRVLRTDLMGDIRIYSRKSGNYSVK